MFGAGVVEVRGTVESIGSGAVFRNRKRYDYLEIEGENGSFRSGRVVASHNVDRLLEPGRSGLFVFVRWAGRNVGMILADNGDGAVNPIFYGKDIATPLLAAFLFLAWGVLLLPIMGVGLILIAYALHLIMLPGRIKKRLKKIAEREAFDWQAITRRDDF